MATPTAVATMPMSSSDMMTIISVVSVMTSTSSVPTETTTSASSSNGGPMKPVQSYLYPSVALVLFVLLTIHMCRFLERRRMVRRGRQMIPRAGSFEYNEHVESLPKPMMYEVEVEGRAGVGRWGDIMPLSATLNTTSTLHPGPKPHPWRRTTNLIHRFWVRISPYPPHWRDSLPGPIVTPPLEAPLRSELLTGVVIAMPSSRTYAKDEIPEVALGYRETIWTPPKEPPLPV